MQHGHRVLVRNRHCIEPVEPNEEQIFPRRRPNAVHEPSFSLQSTVLDIAKMNYRDRSTFMQTLLRTSFDRVKRLNISVRRKLIFHEGESVTLITTYG